MYLTLLSRLLLGSVLWSGPHSCFEPRAVDTHDKRGDYGLVCHSHLPEHEVLTAQ